MKERVDPIAFTVVSHKDFIFEKIARFFRGLALLVLA